MTVQYHAKYHAAIILTAALSSGCEQVDRSENVEVVSTIPVQPVAPKRISVQQIGAFEDPAAYGGVRKVFVINDSKTGVEYIGISGIGISEAGSHWSGKFNAQDER